MCLWRWWPLLWLIRLQRERERERERRERRRNSEVIKRRVEKTRIHPSTYPVSLSATSLMWRVHLWWPLWLTLSLASFAMTVVCTLSKVPMSGSARSQATWQERGKRVWERGREKGCGKKGCGSSQSGLGSWRGRKGQGKIRPGRCVSLWTCVMIHGWPGRNVGGK